MGIEDTTSSGGTASREPCGNAQVIAALLADLVSLGVTEFCVAAGARNAPLLAVLTARADEGEFTVRHFFEERCASFFALGRVMDLQKPVAVVTTSGTAVAELFPAVMEAHYQAAPLVVVTADRPSRYRGSGAPQAVEQENFFGRYVVRTVELEAREDGRLHVSDTSRPVAGPVHYNVCLEEAWDVGGEMPPATARRSVPEVLSPHDFRAWQEFWQMEGRLVVLAGGIHPADVPLARDFLLRLRVPIVAEATANLHGDPDLTRWLAPPSEGVLRELAPQRVLRLGGVPSWRWWRDLEEREDVPVLNVSHAPFPGLARREKVRMVPWRMLAEAFAPPGEAAMAPLDGRLETLLKEYPHSEPSWFRHLSLKIGAGATVFLGNSLPIREWNLAAVPGPAAARFFANRGANGIDGLLSTWLGLSVGASEAWLVAGDLSTLYDLSAPWILPQLPAARRRIVVINNGGGKIFSRVAWLKEAGAPARKVMENPHTLSFAPWAEMWGLEYRRFTDLNALENAEDDEPGCAVWEVRPDAGQTAAFWQAWQPPTQ